MKSRKVDYMIIGAQKAGTTTLHDLLRQHPQIETSILKENLFFSKDEEYRQGIDYFHRMFPKAISEDKIIGTSDVQLLHSLKAPERVFKYNPNVKLIVVLRDPVDRAYSAYNFALQKHMEDRNVSFERRFEEFIMNDLSRYQRDINASFDYFYDGFYGKHLKMWKSLFPKESICVLNFNDIVKNTGILLQEVFSFLCIENLPIELNIKSNQTGNYRFGMIQEKLFNGDNKMISLIGRGIFSLESRQWIRKNVISNIRKQTLVKANNPVLDKELKGRVMQIYKNDQYEIEKEYKIKF